MEERVHLNRGAWPGPLRGLGRAGVLAFALAGCGLFSSTRPMEIADALRAEPEGVVALRGFLVSSPQVLRLCAELLESYPPQCGGPSVEVRGLDPEGVPGYRRDGDAGWTDSAVTVAGRLRGGVFTAAP